MRWQVVLIAVAFIPLSAFCAGLNLSEVIELDGTGRPGAEIGKYMPFVAELNTIFAVDGKHGVKVKVFSEEYPILTLDYLKATNKIIYTYGYGDVSGVAVFDISEKEKYRLDELTKSDTGQLYYYTIFRDVHWIDKSSILYSVIDPVTNEVAICVYDLILKKKKLLAKRQNAVIENYNRKEMLIAYSWPNGNDTSEFEVIDLKNKSELSLGTLPYRSLIVVSASCYLGFLKVQDSQYQSHYQVDIVQDGTIKYSDSTNNIIEPIVYLIEKQLLVAYFARDRILYDRVVGVFQVSYGQ